MTERRSVACLLLLTLCATRLWLNGLLWILSKPINDVESITGSICFRDSVSVDAHDIRTRKFCHRHEAYVFQLLRTWFNVIYILFKLGYLISPQRPAKTVTWKIDEIRKDFEYWWNGAKCGCNALEIGFINTEFKAVYEVSDIGRCEGASWFYALTGRKLTCFSNECLAWNG